MDNKIILVFGLIAFYIFFGILYLAIGNTLNEFNNKETLPDLVEKDYNNPVLGEDTNTLLSFIVSGISGYSESDNLQFVNYFFIFLTALLITTIIIMVLHG